MKIKQIFQLMRPAPRKSFFSPGGVRGRLIKLVRVNIPSVEILSVSKKLKYASVWLAASVDYSRKREI